MIEQVNRGIAFISSRKVISVALYYFRIRGKTVNWHIRVHPWFSFIPSLPAQAAPGGSGVS